VISLVAGTMAVGALRGALLLAGASPSVMAAALAFRAAALLYLAVEELMIEAHEHAETPWLTALFFVGFVLIYVLAEVAG
jgi:ZIP family zinc transporter